MKKSLGLLFTLFYFYVSAQNVGIGTNTPDATAQLDVSSITKGILIPRMTSAQRAAISTPAQGLLVYQTDGVSGFYVNRGSGIFTNWSLITEGTNLWATSLGNSSYIYNVNTGNVGIGTTLPPRRFTVNHSDSAIALFTNSQTLATNVNSNIYLGVGVTALGGYYTGAVRTTGTSASAARMGLFTGAATTANGLLERLSIDNSGNVGINTVTPAYMLDINGRARIRHNGITSGIWLNKSDNAEGAFFGMVNDSTAGLFGNAAVGNWRMGFDVKNAQVGIGITDPSAPLSFASNIGNKIALWGDAAGGHYGLGIQGSLLQIYSESNNSDVTVGYGSSTAFTERMRIKGNGLVGINNSAPGFRLDVNGRMRIGNADGSAGIWFNKPDNTQGSFIGQYDAGNFGIWGPGAVGSWKFLFDGNDGTLRIGTTQKAAGYLLNVGGKIVAEEVRVQLQGSWPDYVFADDYKKLSIIQLEKFIQTNKHLPNMPSAKEVEANGQLVGELQKKMMEKIEELTLYIIDANKEIELMKAEIKALKNK